MTDSDKGSTPLLRTDSDYDPRSVFGRSQILRIFIFQSLGTFILAFGIACTQYIPPLSDKVPNPFHDIFISLSLYLAIVIGAPFTGGHFNPAVTFGFYLISNSKMSKGKLTAYLAAQFTGAIIGVTLSSLFFDCTIIPYPQSVGFLTLINHSIGQMMGGFLFFFVIITVVSPQTTFILQSSWVHMFIPMTLFVARSFSYHVGGVNPAVVSMFELKGVITSGISGYAFLQIVVLQIACIIGAYIASIFYIKLYRPTFLK